jgi:hypothetical protein
MDRQRRGIGERRLVDALGMAGKTRQRIEQFLALLVGPVEAREPCGFAHHLEGQLSSAGLDLSPQRARQQAVGGAGCGKERDERAASEHALAPW